MKDHHRHHTHGNALTAQFGRCCHFMAHRFGNHKRGQEGILEQIRDNPGITQKELAQILEIQPASVSELLAKLEHKGLILRKKDEQDRRVIRVSLAQAGQQVLEESSPKNQDPFSVLTTEEQEQLSILLEKLLADWKQRYPRNRHHQKHHHEQENHYGL